MEMIDMTRSNSGVVEVNYEHRKYSVDEFMRLVSSNGVEGRVSFVARSSADYEVMKSIADKIDDIMSKKSRDRKV